MLGVKSEITCPFSKGTGLTKKGKPCKTSKGTGKLPIEKSIILLDIIRDELSTYMETNMREMMQKYTDPAAASNELRKKDVNEK